MSDINARLEAVGLKAADIMLPKKGTDLSKWAVVACDQYESEKEYWKSASDIVGEAPSTLRLIFPECYLEDNDGDQRIANINASMKKYVDAKRRFKMGSHGCIRP